MFIRRARKNREEQSVGDILESTKSLKYNMIFYSFLIGILSGLVIVAYRILGEKLFEIVNGLYGKASGKPLNIAVVFLCLIIASLFVAFCVRQEPNISGSGIPQVEGIITRRIKVNWKKVLFFKFIGGIISLAAGLSVGREGPSIQMGAAVGEGISRNANRLDSEQKYLITSGASAGLAAAFNAPLAGVMFALEEVHKNFSPVVLTSAMISAVTADMVSKSILGMNPSLRFSVLKIIPIKYYWTLIILGVLVGLSAYVFNHGLLITKHFYKKLPIILELKIMIPFIFSGILGMTVPQLIGGGHEIITKLSVVDYSIMALLVFLVIKYLFTFISFGSGVPGGIFFPLLALGAMIGSIFGIFCVKFLGIPREYIINFAVLAMAGHFAAIVKAPITGIILIFEMTGSFEHLLSLALVVFSALITSDLLGVEPVYDLLLKDILTSKGKDIEIIENDKKTLMEFAVHMGSKVEGKYISEIDWPQNCLVVSVYRGDTEILPRGKTMILEGDMLTVMVNQSDYPKMLDYLNGLTIGA
ncbi:ClC family H(+)/Cl(-) exchange transporter [Peptostreptococcus porci]|uniref:ClC family H(+)/Cl(-) exchange transporter n=1 Tax=Peptostreptococcus porci TaxID=2652282 RepID=UPI002A90D015|nr:ClC family H(+)/Cl(-) exchange transporter [Peptostreptococcus porci]MDY5436704.1 ClC family H(+)/Cl(-) exchange transporter [Peptostreptococcus porci]